MKLFLLATVLAGAALAQDAKHLQITTTDGALVDMAADHMSRDRSVVQLKGNVEIRTHWIDAGSRRNIVLRADEAIYHVDTGEIEAEGKVSVTPVVGEK